MNSCKRRRSKAGFQNIIKTNDFYFIGDVNFVIITNLKKAKCYKIICAGKSFRKRLSRLNIIVKKAVGTMIITKIY